MDLTLLIGTGRLMFPGRQQPGKTLADMGADEAAVERTFLEVVKSIKEPI